MTEAHAVEIDLSAALGADGGVSTQSFSIYIPNKDRHGNEIGNQRQWVLEARDLLCAIILHTLNTGTFSNVWNFGVSRVAKAALCLVDSSLRHWSMRA
jgi:hypothetical protein